MTTMILLGVAAFAANLAAYLAWRHERAHCHQLAELQDEHAELRRVVVRLAEHVRDTSVGPLPDTVEDFVVTELTGEAA